MTLMIELISSVAEAFDGQSYPEDIYYFLLEKVRSAANPEDLGFALGHLLSWKDGKIRRDPAGEFEASMAGVRYKVSKARGNTWGPRHQQILASPQFFAWACQVRTLQHFDAGLIPAMHQQFRLWSENAIVLPAFLLHCLRPQIFPILDRWVLLAHALYANPRDLAPPPKASLASYQRYQEWWLQILQEAGIAPLGAPLNQLKRIDAGLWALGKRAAQLAPTIPLGDSSDLDEQDASAPAQAVSPATLGTDSLAFKQRAVALRNEGLTQREAILQAGAQLNIELKPSYLAYPGSHFDRWKKQGL